ncbi:MAG: hypothetical protein M2R45_02543 [Verrucomicrobia subdivision 3 bacterium]|nr:hypothetical protein [Limisphaerales bacterium]MCS1414249.1 hypothetical protein [Limisphaerales bacterium]
MIPTPPVLRTRLSLSIHQFKFTLNHLANLLMGMLREDGSGLNIPMRKSHLFGVNKPHVKIRNQITRFDI